MSDTKFFRQYLDILNEGPPAGVGPSAPAAPKAPPANQPLGGYDPKSGKAPTQQQADNLMGQIDKAGNQITQGGEKMGAGNYVSGAMDAARGANDLLNAAGATTADKLKMGWTGLKAGANAGLAYLRGKGEEGALAAATGTVGQELTQPMANYAKSKTFDKDFNQAMGAPNANDPKMAQMQQDAQRNLITSNSMKNYMTGVNKTMGDLKSGDTTAFDRLGQQTMYRQDTMSPYLDISKKQAMTGQRVQTPGELMGQEEPSEPATPQQPQPTTEERDDDMDNRQLMRKYMDFLDEAPATAINPNDKNAAVFGKQINAPVSNTNTNVDTRATAQRDKLAQQMASGKINTPAPQTVDPNQKYGGGYDPSKVKYADGGATSSGYTAQSQAQKTAPAASATQSAALDASTANAIGGNKQATAPAAPTASATQSAALDASKANAIGGNKQATAPTFTGMAGNPQSNPTFTGMAGNPQQNKGASAQRAAEPSLASQYVAANQPQSATTAKPAPATAQASAPSLASQYVSANQPQTATAATSQPTSDVLATQALNSQDQGTSGQSKGIPAGFGQVAEEEGDNDDKLLARMIDLIRK